MHYQIRIQSETDTSPRYLDSNGGIAKFDSVFDAKWEAEKFIKTLPDALLDITEVDIVQVSEKVVSRVSRYTKVD